MSLPPKSSTPRSAVARFARETGIAGSKSSAGRMLSAVTSTFKYGATAWMTPNWAGPVGVVALRSTARASGRNHLLEQLQPFGGHAVLEQHEPGDVAARSREALDIARQRRDRPSPGTRSARPACAATMDPRWRSHRPARRTAPPRPAPPHGGGCRSGLVPPSGYRSAHCGRRSTPHAVCCHEGTDLAFATGSCTTSGRSTPMRRCRSRLLRRAAERPRRSAAEQRDELAPLHSITSSARASSVGGTVRPSALAVCRLMTNSNLVDCKTGRSAGLAPLRI